jgi:hypothetical protein
VVAELRTASIGGMVAGKTAAIFDMIVKTIDGIAATIDGMLDTIAGSPHLQPKYGTLRSAGRKFPYVRYHERWNLVTWHPQAILDDAMADRMVEFIEGEERESETPFNRHVDYNGLIEIRFTIAQTFHIAQRRRARYNGPPVKGAFFAS